MKHVNRIAIYLLGLLFLALGSVFSIKSDLGVSPISSLPFSINAITNISMGMASTILFCVYVCAQIVLLKKEFRPLQFLQILAAILFGQAINFLNTWIKIGFDDLYLQFLLCILSLICTALGVVFTITANIVPVAPDGLTQVISLKTKVNFGRVKIYFDCIVVILSAILLLVNINTLTGIGIGTILSAILVGKMVMLLNKYLKSNLEKIIF
jgi:uncharacterized membrane protein YczE